MNVRAIQEVLFFVKSLEFFPICLCSELKLPLLLMENMPKPETAQADASGIGTIYDLLIRPPSLSFRDFVQGKLDELGITVRGRWGGQRYDAVRGLR